MPEGAAISAPPPRPLPPGGGPPSAPGRARQAEAPAPAGRPSALWPVVLEGLRFETGGRVLLDGVSLTLAPGPLTCIMGPNGAGKSLLLRLIAGLVRPSGGRLSFGASPVPPPGRIGLVFQRPVLLRRSVRANLAHALALAGVPRRERQSGIRRLLADAGLEALADQPARRLSGGEQQRLALVRALAAEPELLLLDEPAASLDPQATAAVEALIARVAARGVKVVVVTHDRDQAARLAEDVVFLHRGRVLERAPASMFFAAPRTAEARAYLAGALLV